MKSKTIFTSLVCVLATTGLVACGSSSNGNESPKAQNPPAQTADSGTPKTTPTAPTKSQDSTTTKDETVAKDAFLKTLAAGSKKWNLKNVVVDYVKSDGRGGAAKEKWTANCSSPNPATLDGTYPSVTLNLGAFDCGSAHQPSELTDLQLITGNMVYSATHIPAYPSEPNQFRLSLQSINNYGYFNWKSQSSLNALTKDHAVFLDFLGEQKGDIGWQDDKNHFIQMSFQRAADGTEKLSLDYTLDANGRQESTEINIKADLQRTN